MAGEEIVPHASLDTPRGVGRGSATVPPPAARALAASAAALVATALPLGPRGLGRVVRLAGASAGVSLALACAAAVVVWGARRPRSVAPLALIAATLFVGPLLTAARLVGALRALPALELQFFVANLDVLAELHGASYVAAALAAALCAARVVALWDAPTPRLAASSLLVAAAARALASGVTAVTLQLAHDDGGAAARRLTLAALIGWAGPLLGALGLGLARHRARRTDEREAQTAAALVLVAIVAGPAVDGAALCAWGTLGRPDLSDGVRLPDAPGAPPASDGLPWNLAVTRNGTVVLPDGRRFALTAPALALHLRARFSPELPAGYATEGGDVLCAGKVIAMNELRVVADASLRRPALEALVAAAEDAAVSKLTLLARADDRAASRGWGAARLLPPAVATVTLLLAPTRRSCPRAMGRDRVARLPDVTLDALLRGLAGRVGRANNPAGVLYTADPAREEPQ